LMLFSNIITHIYSVPFLFGSHIEVDYKTTSLQPLLTEHHLGVLAYRDSHRAAQS